MLIKYSVEEIVSRAFTYLSETTPINNFYAGGIARSIVESIAKEIGESGKESVSNVYRFMEEVLNQGYISKAEGPYLDLIGELFNYKRRKEWGLNEKGEEGEYPITDTEYRIELTQQLLILSSSNETALRFKLLMIPGIKDVIPEEYTLGTGSFKFTLIEEYGYSNQELLEEARKVLQATKALGVKYEVDFPKSIRFDIEIKQIFKAGISEVDVAISQAKVKAYIEQWIASKEPGEGIIYKELIKVILESSESLIDFEVISWKIDQKPIMLTNYNIDIDERFIVGTIKVI